MLKWCVFVMGLAAGRCGANLDLRGEGSTVSMHGAELSFACQTPPTATARFMWPGTLDVRDQTEVWVWLDHVAADCSATPSIAVPCAANGTNHPHLFSCTWKSASGEHVASTNNLSPYMEEVLSPSGRFLGERTILACPAPEAATIDAMFGSGAIGLELSVAFRNITLDWVGDGEGANLVTVTHFDSPPPPPSPPPSPSLPPASPPTPPPCSPSCEDIKANDPSAVDGEYLVCPSMLGGRALMLYCLMSNTHDGGAAMTILARTRNRETLGTVPYNGHSGANGAFVCPPPRIADTTKSCGGEQIDTWATWSAHSWRDDLDYYVSLSDFDLLSKRAGGSTSKFMQFNREESGELSLRCSYRDINYEVSTNVWGYGTKTGSYCSSTYSWSNYPPKFDGPADTPGDPDCIKGDWAMKTFNWHNNAGCTSGSQLFVYDASRPEHPKPQDVGSYTNSKYETLFGICFSC